MRYLFFENAHPVTRLFLTVFVTLSSVIIFSLVAIGLSVFIFDVSFTGINEYLKAENPDNIPFIKFFQSFYTVGIFLVPAFILAFLFSKKPTKYLFSNKAPTIFFSVLSVITVLSAIPFINYIGMLNSNLKLPDFLSGMDKNLEKSVIALLKADSIFGLIINIFVIAFLPAVGEEFLFRGILQKLFTDWTKNKHFGILIAAVIFSAFHFQFSGFFPRFLLGVMFGYLLVWTENIWIPVLTHFFNNATAVIAFYLLYDKGGWEAAENFGTEQGQLIIVFISFVTSVFIFFVIKKYSALSGK